MTEAIVLTRDDEKRNTRAWVIAIAIPLAIVLAALMVYRASFAAFTATTPSGQNNWATGTVLIDNDMKGEAVFNEVNLAPGATGTKTVTVTYTGTIPTVDVRMYAQNPTGTQDLAADINLTITNEDAQTVFTGTLATFQQRTGWTDAAQGEVALTTAPGNTEEYTITYVVAPSAQEANAASVVFVWEAQSR
ncbi:hypothetical protein FLP10_10365 [Agromyces intestinalis]|uniref:Uncharacterized protein n=1 Tax=Agromyces intestinalis TaxID=2592652 RepID=A0A5C1YGN2_9MICO|nr:hypothetical protein [Agromyces intestinalis]QEO14768.1 hypothetical protein FLP10_10365 [Agromyces intestinalis]